MGWETVRGGGKEGAQNGEEVKRGHRTDGKR